MRYTDRPGSAGDGRSRAFLITNHIVFFIFAIMLICTSQISAKTDFSLSTPVKYNNNWTITENDAELTVTAEHAAETMMSRNALSFMTSGCYVDAYLDGRSIYHFGSSPRFGTSPGTYQHMIEFPSNVKESSRVTIKVTASDPSKYKPDLDFILGSTTDIAVYFIDQNKLMYLNSIFIMAFGIVLILLFIIDLRSGKNAANLYLGLLMIDFSAWLSAKSFISELFLMDPQQQYYSSYFFSFMLPLFLVNYIRLILPDIKCHIEYICLLAVISACIILHFTNILSLSVSSRYFAFVMSATVLSLTVKMVIRLIRQRKMSPMDFSRLVFMSCMILNSVIYSMGISVYESISIIQLGLMIYIIMSIYTGIHDLIVTAEKITELEVYRKYAFTDSLTGLGNRFAYNTYMKDADIRHIAIFSLDLNNLKYYNDNFGHITGDELISTAAEVLKNAFPLVFRVGGDEFAAITDLTDDETLRSMKENLRSILDEHNNKNKEPVLEIACGFSYYMEGDTSSEDMIHRADMEMYSDKNLLKAVSRISINKTT